MDFIDPTQFCKQSVTKLISNNVKVNTDKIRMSYIDTFRTRMRFLMLVKNTWTCHLLNPSVSKLLGSKSRDIYTPEMGANPLELPGGTCTHTA